METKLQNFQWQKPEVVPAFVQGVDAEAVYKSLSGMNLGWNDYQTKTQTLRGSNPFIAARIDTLVRPYGIRVANLRDLSRPEVMSIVKDRYYADIPAFVAHYADIPAFVLRTMEDSNSRNLTLIKRLAEEVERVNGKLELPLMVTGFDVVPLENDNNGYGITIAPRDDFKAIHDDKLKGEYNGRTFSEVDELGLPKFDSRCFDFDRSGSRTWYARQKGVSGLCLYGRLDLGSGSKDLAGSHSDGRIVLISGEGSAKN